MFIFATAISGTLVGSRLGILHPDICRFHSSSGSGIWVLFCWRLLRSVLTPPCEFREFLRQCDEIGSKSLPLVALAGVATGVVMSLQTRNSLVRFGAKSFSESVPRDHGPLLRFHPDTPVGSNSVWLLSL
jgi:hypothetical protein